MKKALKWVLLTLFVAVGSSAMAQQKLAYINTDELIMAMPERAEAAEKYETLYNELVNQMESMQVEYRRQLDEYTKEMNTLTAAVQSMREQSLNDLRLRLQESEQLASQELQTKQGELYNPVIEKATNTIQEVARANGVTAVFDITSLLYFDEANMLDLLPLVKQAMGIQ